MTYAREARITACPPIYAGREPGAIKSIGKDASGIIYQIELDKYPGITIPFRPQDLETECTGGGGAHEWDDGVCAKCFEAKEVK
ncbi:MAG: hypothetical protein V1854_05015 [Methanobacteriota archaeon]